MTPLHMLVSDPALHEAIAEALALADYAASDDLNSGEIDVLILDESAATRERLQQFQDGAYRRTRIFFLGEESAGWRERPLIEFFPKPLRLGHLLARIALSMKAVRRAESLRFGPWLFEPQTRQIVRPEDGQIVRLTEKETALLDYLGQSTAPVSREELLAAIWGYDGRIETHTLETHIYQLRRKLDPDGKGISLLINEGGAYFLNMSAA